MAKAAVRKGKNAAVRRDSTGEDTSPALFLCAERDAEGENADLVSGGMVPFLVGTQVRESPTKRV